MERITGNLPIFSVKVHVVYNPFHKDGSSKSNAGLREKQNVHILNDFP
jgi:hypothetical protein